ncbi:acetyl-CoA carboxylase carboxyltransferase subunit alpha [Peredibacter sp. HCB2-198]|uniref:acetyl-CoA carboxylase carboxyltransferase subunit alpha n=1 Tax=Peredibacter sp. HCB2-198 TaxID=3383025 RepID=UPI0038B4F90D
MDFTLEFERPVSELENQIRELKQATHQNIDISHEIEALQAKVDRMLEDIYTKLSPWQRTQLSRHPSRPHAIDYIEKIVADFHEVHGDRRFSDDPSMIAGFGYIDGQKVAVIGIEKGRKTQEKIKRNFGMANPEGYRKAIRVMQMASQFSIPVVTFVDTPGAYPGIGAEERGQALAIAENLEEMFNIKAPIISIVIGEGGSGGALGIAVADKVFMMEYSVYSVISPESCASILWSDPKMAETAANSLQLSPNKALELKVIDGLIKEPAGGAHRYPDRAVAMVKDAILASLEGLKKDDLDVLMQKRFEKFRQMGNLTLTIDQSEG